MNIDDENMVEFIKELSCSFSTNGYKEKDTFSLNNVPLNIKECIYLLDFVKNKVIYNRGFQNVLGYSDDAIDFGFIINNHHPDDSEMVNRISKAAILYCLDNHVNVLNNVLFISYRRKKKDGSYIKVLSESCIYEIDGKGFPTKGFAKITDISFMDTSDIVNWTFQAKDLDKEDFKKQIQNAYYNFFTKREKEIITEISNGLTSDAMAKKLNISVHTISTHRKHILKKANRHNTKDLLLFCRRKGII